MLVTMTRRSAMLLSGLPVATPLFAFDATQKGQRRSRTKIQDPVGNALIQWKPLSPFPGAPILFSSKTFSGPAKWLDKTIEFRPDGDGYTALAGANLNRTPGRYPLTLGDQTVEVTIVKHTYRSSTITVPQKYLEPPPEIRKRIAEESQIKRQVFKSSPPQRLWQGAFQPPTKTRHTSPFGSRRVYNGKTRSVHQGLDFSATIGTPVSSANTGRVVIAQQFYFEGGFVVIDHGESIFTLYMHLSEFLVKEGAVIEKGVPIAKSGSSGRVTGPHLHFAMQWQGAYLDPATLLQLWAA